LSDTPAWDNDANRNEGSEHWVTVKTYRIAEPGVTVIEVTEL